MLIVPVPAALDDPAALVNDTYRVLLARPINPSEPTFRHDPLLPICLTRDRREVAWRMLTDGALRARPPVAAQRAPRRNVGTRWSNTGPLPRQAQTGTLPTSADKHSLTSPPKPEGVGLVASNSGWDSGDAVAPTAPDMIGHLDDSARWFQ